LHFLIEILGYLENYLREMDSDTETQHNWISRALDFKGKTLAYKVAGKGKTIVLLHGYLASSVSWIDIGLKLANFFNVIAIDLPGHGKSAAWPPIHTMEFMAEAVKEILDKENHKNACIAGHSLGGYVALAFANLYSEVTDSLILINSDPFQDTEKRRNRRDREIALIHAGKKELLLTLTNANPFLSPNQPDFELKRKELINDGLSVPDEAIIATILGMKKRIDRCFVVENQAIRTLFILGKKDTQLNYQYLMQRFEKLNSVKFVIFENVAHMALVEDPGSVLLQIIEFYSGK
jgi:pimeloyl-ACP methyl ester carboxylesterase